jgi:hypothetical protein
MEKTVEPGDLDRHVERLVGHMEMAAFRRRTMISVSILREKLLRISC